ncbi:MAG: T9SS type A sorting domain-containing protein [Bacteroidia bacterium]|jgi:hypothetical protein|nr:T9SS type A sorting domain-containing protein [Bacteroidia bacterium]
MKRTITICALLLGMSTAHSQYFRNTYGAPTNQRTTNGTASAALGTYTSVAAGDPSISPNFEVRVLNTDLVGAINFANSYILVDPVTGATLNANPHDVEEHNGNYYISGMVINGGAQQAFLLIVDGSGTVLNVQQYNVRPGDNIKHVNVTASNSSPHLFITGTLDASASVGLPVTFAIRVDAMGNPIWNNLYIPVTASSGVPYQSLSFDAINTGYNNQGTNGELVLIGTANNSTTPNSWAYMQFIDPASGAPLPINNTLIDFGVPVSIRSITANTAINGYTFVGSYNLTSGSPVDGFVVNTDGLGNLIWAVTYDQTFAPGNQNQSLDIMERYNTSGVNEFYISGDLSAGFQLGQIVKMDNLGNIVPNGEFVSIPGGFATSIAYPAIANSPALDGFAAFGTANPGAFYMELDKAYYNGVIDPPTTCDFLRNSLPSNFIGGGVQNDLNKFTSYFTNNNLSANFGGFGLISSCFTSSNPSGSNAKRGPSTDGANAIEVKLSATELEMKVRSAEVLAATSAPQPVEVSIMDMTGKLILKRTVTVSQSNSAVSINFDGLVLPDGIYAVTCQIENETISQKVLISK